MPSAYAALLIGALVCLARPSTLADFPKAADELYRGQMSDALSDAAAQREILEAKAQASWTAEDFEPYLMAATSAIEMALVLFDLRHGALPGHLDVLRESKIIEDWPGNPFEDWKPMAQLSGGVDFEPGAIVFQKCPQGRSYGARHPVVECFVLSAFGPTPRYKPLGKLPPLPEWAEAPKGTAAVGVFQPPTMTEILRKLAERKQREKDTERSKPQGGGKEG